MLLHDVYIGLGSNVGNRQMYLHDAVVEIGRRIGAVVRCSDVICTEPVGFSSKNEFLNMVLCVRSGMSALDILHATQDIERLLGRREKSVNRVYHDRTIDIDILLYDDLVVCLPQLVIPHPLMTQRRFVMEPLAQIAPRLVIPGQRLTTVQLLALIS